MSCNKKWVKLIFNSEETVDLSKIDGFEFIQYEKYEVQGNNELLEVKGTDGVLPSLTTFEPFPINLKFRYTGVDSLDVDLFLQHLDSLMFSREPYFLVHSITPNKKYAVLPTPKITYEYITLRHYDINIEFTCYKGYAELLYDTDQFSLMSDNWQFESGLLPDNEITYTHKRSNFEIFNGSSDTINPRMRHKLKIYMQLTANNGFRLVNKTTGDIFQYKQAIDINTPLVLEGGYPYLIVNDKYSRCGRSTNHGIITLAPGYNKFEIWGNAADVNIKFIFPFIYR
ncbi:phage tail family protein [Mammaliicoccus sciuri]|uniref:phage tail domain-containing protein n=1 Tax=Mammaliicoccus sciuri TaxID=1296 RepID=UPI001FB41A56|nr:phage tail domain-containing protein [Mammaliicoccus sciuri]MCJ0907696.1 phage tail family protein [Mammaliicoccus sciuri]